MDSPSFIVGKMQILKLLIAPAVVFAVVLMGFQVVVIHHLLEWQGSPFQGWVLAIGIHLAVMTVMTWIWVVFSSMVNGICTIVDKLRRRI